MQFTGLLVFLKKIITVLRYLYQIKPQIEPYPIISVDVSPQKI